jgi:hypothetical protein
VKTLKALIAAAALATLAAFAFAPPADASPRGYERGGHGYHRPHGHWHKRHHYRGPRFSHPRFWGPRLSIGFAAPVLPLGFVSLRVGGDPYFYQGGYYYRPAPVGYVVVPPPVGAPVVVAPTPATTVTTTVTRGPGAYAPGQVLESLPEGYTAEVINGVQYYRYGSDYFMPTQRDGREVYVVVQI